jgi:hypothetical protein
MGKRITTQSRNRLKIIRLSFGRKLATLVKTVQMKTIIQFLYTLNILAFSKEKMPALIPVRVITKIHPDHR